jgi:hypothetical protein
MAAHRKWLVFYALSPLLICALLHHLHVDGCYDWRRDTAPRPQSRVKAVYPPNHHASRASLICGAWKTVALQPAPCLRPPHSPRRRHSPKPPLAVAMRQMLTSATLLQSRES